MKRSLLYAVAILIGAAFLSGCEKEPAKVVPTATVHIFKVDAKLPANYQAAGVDVTAPTAVLSALDLTAEEFTSEFGKSVKFGYATTADVANVKWESENNGGKYGHWFDANGAKASGSNQVLHIQSNCAWGQSAENVTSFNVNLAEAAYTQGASYKAIQAIGHDRDGVTDVVFIEWSVVVNEEKPFATGSATFSMTTGILANIKMIPTTSGNEYSTLEIDMPDAVYATVKSISGYDALAYFITSGQIKCYAFPGAASVGAAGTEFWFNASGAVAEESAAVVKTSLYLESGNPLSGGGKTVKLLVSPKVGAAVTAGTNFKCGYVMVYGTMKIPVIANVTVVNSL